PDADQNIWELPVACRLQRERHVAEPGGGQRRGELSRTQRPDRADARAQPGGVRHPDRLYRDRPRAPLSPLDTLRTEANATRSAAVESPEARSNGSPARERRTLQRAERQRRSRGR